MSTPHFDISAAVVRQLGDELVSDEVTAIIELVKNAYDADADYANVVVNTTEALSYGDTKFPHARGYITIDDNGMGMNRTDIERGWLMISLSGKRVMKAAGFKTPKGRVPLGDKGLGRLSTQKLGRNLELFTRKDGASETLHVSFDWAAFTDERSLSEVPVSIEKTIAGRDKGTLLAISALQNPDVWRGEAVAKLVNDLSQIISPFSEARPFLVTLQIDGRPFDLGLVSERIRSAAIGRFVINYIDGNLNLYGKFRLAKLRGNEPAESFERHLVQDNGKSFFNYLSKKKTAVKFCYSDDSAYFMEFVYQIPMSELGGIETISSAETIDVGILADPGPFHCEIDEFLLRSDETGLKLSGLTSSNEINQVIKRHVGIKIFRDGFAVKPYGLNGEDWLRLGAQQTSGASWYGLRPQNVIGFVAISETSNAQLKEKTDREGFVSNPYSQNFRRLMFHAVETIANFYEWTRRNYNAYKAELPEKSKPFESGRKAILDAEGVSRRIESYSRSARALDVSTAATQKKISSVTRKIQQTPILASAAERELADLLIDANKALEASQSIFVELNEYAAEAKDLANIVTSLSPRLDVLNDQLQDFAELAGLGLLAEALSHEVQNQTDRLMQKAAHAVAKARKISPKNVDLIVFGQEVTSAASALRKQISHLSPSLRYQRDKIETFQIKDFINGICGHFADRWVNAGISVSVQDGSQDFVVATNRGRLIQVIDNILLNAEYWLVQAKSRNRDFNSILTIAFAAPRLRIWDNAGGIDPAVEDALFEPFVTLKPKNQGRGLGLFISSQILESMGCTITLLSDRNTRGRRYIFELDLSGITNGN